MMNNNWQRLDIWLCLRDRFDSKEFQVACESRGVVPQPVLEFAQKAGMISCAIVAYPELPVSEAYLKFIKENQSVTVLAPNTETRKETQPCGGCGGGKVR